VGGWPVHLRWGKRGSDGAHQDLIDQLEAARQEWRAARAYFDSVSDSDLVLEAVHRLEASQRKYIHLWKTARAQGLRVDRERMARFLLDQQSGISS